VILASGLAPGCGANLPEKLEHSSCGGSLFELGKWAGPLEEIGHVGEVARSSCHQLEDNEILDGNDRDLQSLRKTEADCPADDLPLPRPGGADYVDLGPAGGAEPQEQGDRIVRPPIKA